MPQLAVICQCRELLTTDSYPNNFLSTIRRDGVTFRFAGGRGGEGNGMM